MTKKIKLIWDFRGTTANEIAKHHLIHLNEYATIEKLDMITSGVASVSELHCIAYMVVKESDMKPVRDALKPHRGTLYEE